MFPACNLPACNLATTFVQRNRPDFSAMGPCVVVFGTGKTELKSASDVPTHRACSVVHAPRRVRRAETCPQGCAYRIWTAGVVPTALASAKVQ
jgi:hypothetical protein